MNWIKFGRAFITALWILETLASINLDTHLFDFKVWVFFTAIGAGLWARKTQ